MLPELGARRSQNKEGRAFVQGEWNEEQDAERMSISKNDPAQTSEDEPDPKDKCRLGIRCQIGRTEDGRTRERCRRSDDEDEGNEERQLRR